MKKNYFIYSLIASSTLIAQENADQASSNQLEQNTSINEETQFITASRSGRDINTIAAYVTVIDKDKIAKSNARNVAEVLKYEAGVTIKKSLNDADKFNIDVRGFGEVSAQNTLVLIDGRKVNKPDLSGYDLTTIPLNRIERIEIYRGGRSVLYGDNATGGVVNIITKNASPNAPEDKQNRLTLNSEVGSWEYYKLGANLEGFRENLYYNIDSSYSDSNGYHDESGYNTKTLGFSVLSTEFEQLELFVAAGASDSNVQHSGSKVDKRNSGNNNRRYTKTEEQYLNVAPKYWITDDVSIEIQGSLREAKRDPDDNGFGPFAPFETNDLSISPKMNIHSDFGSFTNNLAFGIDHRYSEMLDFQFGASDEIIKRDTGVYFYNSTALMDETLFIDFGYRREQSRLNLNNGTSDKNDLDSFSLGLTYNYYDNSKVYVSYDRSFRTQKVDELGGAFFNEILDPQISKTWQAGFQHQFNDKLSAGLTIFNINTDNEIFYDSTVGFFGQNYSYGKTERTGFELNTDYLFTDDFSVYANYTYMDAELGKDSPSGDANDGNTIPGVAEQFANLGFSWNFIEDWSLNINAHWKEDMYVNSDFANSTDKQDSYVTVDTKITYTWKWLSIYGGINNLFDEKYSEYSATFGEYTGAERNFFTGFTATYEF